MERERQVILISEDEELYKSLKMALTKLFKIKVFMLTEIRLKYKNWTIFLVISEEKLQEYLYEKIRSKYLNPVIVIGFKEKDIFEKEYPLFYDHPYNHAYLKIPFDLIDVFDLLKNMIPVSSEEIRTAICGSEPGYKGYLLKLLSHDLLKDRNRCTDILKLVENFLNDKESSEEIIKTIDKIKVEAKWHEIASEIGKKLESKIMENKNVQKG